MEREAWLGHDEGVASILFREERQSVGGQGEVRTRINKGWGDIGVGNTSSDMCELEEPQGVV